MNCHMTVNMCLCYKNSPQPYSTEKTSYGEKTVLTQKIVKNIGPSKGNISPLTAKTAVFTDNKDMV